MILGQAALAREIANRSNPPMPDPLADLRQLSHDLGLPLALAIRERTHSFVDKLGMVPRLILLESHGVIALGATPQAVLGAMLMMEKASATRLGAAVLGGPQFLTLEQIASLAGRREKAYRQRQLRM